MEGGVEGGMSKLHAKNQLPRSHVSGPIFFPRKDRQTDRVRYRSSLPELKNVAKTATQKIINVITFNFKKSKEFTK